jgi:hypothetical protein
MSKPLSSNNNPGCLASLLKALGVKAKSSSESSLLESDSFPYRIRDDFLSHAEQSFYLVLKSMMGDHLTICTKVSLADLFFVIRPNENKSAFNRINRKHVDFLLCDPKKMTPIFAVELDDSSHERDDRVERDEFVDNVFKAAGLPLIHISVRSSYNTGELGVLFRQAIQKSDSKPETDGSPNEAPPQETQLTQPLATNQSTPPVCPKCGIPMVLRTAERGSNAGKKFYGCANYPKCQEVIPE